MDEILKSLYDNFYKPPETAELKREIEDNHRMLIEWLEKPERKLVLRIIDAKDSIAGQLHLQVQAGVGVINRTGSLQRQQAFNAGRNGWVGRLFRISGGGNGMKNPLVVGIVIITACATGTVKNISQIREQGW